MKRTLLGLGLALLQSQALAAPATRLLLLEDNCTPTPPVITCLANIPIYRLEYPITFWILALDSTGNKATNYTGTVQFSSPDSTAVIPAHTFTQADSSVFLATVTFYTPGSIAGQVPGTNRQFLTAADAAHQLGQSIGFNLLGAPVVSPPSIPALDLTNVLVLSLVLYSLGAVGVARQRSAPNPSLKRTRIGILSFAGQSRARRLTPILVT